MYRIQTPCSAVTCAYLPDTDDGVGYENQQDDKRLHEGCNGLLSLFKPGQHLWRDKTKEEKKKKNKQDD